MNPIIIRSGSIEVEIETHHGRIVRLEDRKRHISLVGEKMLAENFRLLVPLPDLEAHYILGNEQILSDAHTASDRVELIWRTLSSSRGSFPIEFQLSIEVEDEAVVFRSAVRNDSPHTVQEVFTPSLGGMYNPQESDQWNLIHSSFSGNGQEWNFYTNARSFYIGPRDVTYAFASQAMPWIDLYNCRARKGVYICCEDPAPRLGSWFFQLKPGANWGGTDWVWPDPKVEGQPVGLTLAWVNFPYVRPGQHWQSSPVAFRFHDGIWYEAARIYRRWYDRHFKIDHSDSWLDQADAWQSTIIHFPEGTVEHRFKDLPRMAEDALSAGIRVLQIDGWHRGGIDSNYPHYEPDPKLGTADDLRQAIAQCEQMGVKVLLFVNMTPANVETEWYARELHQFTTRNARGIDTDTHGWGFDTVSALVTNTKYRMRLLNPLHPRWAEIVQQQFDKVIALGCAGVQVDKIGNGLEGGIDGHPELRHISPDLTKLQGVIASMARLLKEARKVRPDFCIASETHNDRFIPYVNASYARHWFEDTSQIIAVTFPELRQTCCVTGGSDFALVANCLRWGFIINIEAKCLHGTIADVPAMRSFVKAAVDLRHRLWDEIWMSRLVDPAGIVHVEADARVKYCVHQSRTKPDRHTLVLNHFARTKQMAKVDFPGRERKEAKVHAIRAPAYGVTLPAEIQIPADDAIVVIPNS